MAIKVLVADELPEVTDLLQFYLSKNEKYAPILTTNCVDDVIRIVGSERPDLIFIDTLWHGNLRGLDIYTSIKADDHDGTYYPVVIGISASPDFKPLWNNKGVPFLLKPISLGSLRETLESVL